MFVLLAAHGFGRMAYTLILPEMSEGLTMNYTQAGLLSTGNFIGYVCFCLIGGSLASKYGSRIIITICLIFMSVTMFLTGTARTFEAAFLLRFLTGLAHSGAYVPAMALGAAWFSAKRRGFAIGVVSAGVGIGIVISSFVVPAILNAYGGQGWRFVWYYLAVGVMAVAVIAGVFIRNHPQDMGLQTIGDNGARSTDEESGGQAPLQWSLVFRSNRVWHLGIVYFMNGMAYVMYVTFFKAFLTAEMGLPDAQVNLMWMMVGVLSIFSGIFWGVVSDIIGRKYGIALAYVTLTISFIIFAFFNSVFILYVSVIIFGLGLASVATIITAAIRDYVGPRLAPAGLGFVTVFLGLGQVLGPAGAGRIADTMHTFRPVYLLAALISLLGLAASLALKEPGDLSKVTEQSIYPAPLP